MTLDEAIEHLDETLSDENKEWACKDCKNEHKQLREWLNELRQFKKLPESENPHTTDLLKTQGWKVLADTTLRRQTKQWLIDYIRCLEHNWSTSVEREEEQYALLQKAYDDGFLKAVKEDLNGEKAK